VIEIILIKFVNHRDPFLYGSPIFAEQAVFYATQFPRGPYASSRRQYAHFRECCVKYRKLTAPEGRGSERTRGFGDSGATIGGRLNQQAEDPAFP